MRTLVLTAIVTFFCGCSSDTADTGFDLGETPADMSGDLDMRVEDAAIEDVPDDLPVDLDSDQTSETALVRFLSVTMDIAYATSLDVRFPDGQHPNIPISTIWDEATNLGMPWEWREVPAGSFRFELEDEIGRIVPFEFELEPDAHSTFVLWGYEGGLNRQPPFLGFVKIDDFRAGSFGATKNLTVVNSAGHASDVTSVLIDDQVIDELDALEFGEARTLTGLSSETQILEFRFESGEPERRWIDGAFGGQSVIFGLSGDQGLPNQGLLWDQESKLVHYLPRPRLTQLVNISNMSVEIGYNSERLWMIGPTESLAERQYLPAQAFEDVELLIRNGSDIGFATLPYRGGWNAGMIVYTPNGLRGFDGVVDSTPDTGVIIYNGTGQTASVDAETVQPDEFLALNSQANPVVIEIGATQATIPVAGSENDVVTVALYQDQQGEYRALTADANSTAEISFAQ